LIDYRREDAIANGGEKSIKTMKRAYAGTAAWAVPHGGARLLAVISILAGRADSFNVPDQVC
jgi:hypothetical protein